ncbi:MAG: Transcriptional regulator, LacI family, partial [uncultured Thermomicrobiales bacterium]
GPAARPGPGLGGADGEQGRHDRGRGAAGQDFAQHRFQRAERAAGSDAAGDPGTHPAGDGPARIYAEPTRAAAQDRPGADPRPRHPLRRQPVLGRLRPVRRGGRPRPWLPGALRQRRARPGAGGALRRVALGVRRPRRHLRLVAAVARPRPGARPARPAGGDLRPRHTGRRPWRGRRDRQHQRRQRPWRPPRDGAPAGPRPPPDRVPLRPAADRQPAPTAGGVPRGTPRGRARPPPRSGLGGAAERGVRRCRGGRVRPPRRPRPARLGRAADGALRDQRHVRPRRLRRRPRPRPRCAGRRLGRRLRRHLPGGGRPAGADDGPPAAAGDAPDDGHDAGRPARGQPRRSGRPHRGHAGADRPGVDGGAGGCL